METIISILTRFVADAVWCCTDSPRVVDTFPNGNVMTLALTREPGRATWITRRDYEFNGSPLYWHRTTYDAEGRPTETEDSLTSTRQWLYNRRSELVGTAGTQAHPYDYDYSYDSIGNRLTASDGSGAIPYTSNELNQYTSLYLRGETLLYDPYGNILQATGPLASQLSFGFSTKYHDREVNLVAYQLRTYNLTYGRWLNRDPIEEAGGENLYAFCSNGVGIGVDVDGCARMLTNVLYREAMIERDPDKNTVPLLFGGEEYALRIIQLVRELNLIKCVDAKICDLVTTPIDEVRKEVKANRENVYFISHGGLRVNGKLFNDARYYWKVSDSVEELISPFGESQRNSDDVVPIQTYGNVNMQNVFGCYLSPHVRKRRDLSVKGRLVYYSSIDDYRRMYEELYVRLSKYRQMQVVRQDRRCSIRIRIYEGEIINQADDETAGTDYVLDWWAGKTLPTKVTHY